MSACCQSSFSAWTPPRATGRHAPSPVEGFWPNPKLTMQNPVCAWTPPCNRQALSEYCRMGSCSFPELSSCNFPELRFSGKGEA